MSERVLSNSSAENTAETLLDHKSIPTTNWDEKENSPRRPQSAINNKHLTGPHNFGVSAKRGASTKAAADSNEMSGDLSDSDKAKRAAAFACGNDHLKSGQRIGVGSGTTSKFLVDFIKEKFESGQLTDIVCVPTSFLTRQWLLEAGLPVATPEQQPTLDVAVDGADEIDEKFACIKGGGGCLTQEKIVQSCAKKYILIADKSKRSPYLGKTFKYVPIEVVPFAYTPVKNWIEKEHGGKCELRMSKTKCGAAITDNNNYILDWHFPEASVETDWRPINTSILCRPGVVETGLFIGATDHVYLGSADGDVTKLRAK